MKREFDDEITDLMGLLGLAREQAVAIWYATATEKGLVAFTRGIEELHRARPETQAEEIAYWEGRAVGEDESNLGPERECVYKDQGLWTAWQKGHRDGRKSR